MRIKKPQHRRDNVRRVQELRRSNASQPIPNKRKYNRKSKYRKYDD